MWCCPDSPVVCDELDDKGRLRDGRCGESCYTVVLRADGVCWVLSEGGRTCE